MADIFLFDFDNAKSVLLQAAYSLRYEITCGIVLFVLWFMSGVAGIAGGRGKLASKFAAKDPDKRFPMKARQSTATRSQPQVRSKGPSVLHSDLNPNSAAAPSTGNMAFTLSHLNSMDQAQLCDPNWVLQQVTQLCRTQAHSQNGFTVYRTAMRAGLQLQDMPPDDCQQLFAILVISCVRSNQMNEVTPLLKDLRHAGLSVRPSLFASVVKLCTSKHLFLECLTVYDFVAEDSTFSLTDKSIWSCLLFCAIESRVYKRCEYFFNCLKACGTPSHKDYGNMVRFASLHGDWQLSLRLIQEMRDASIDVDCVIYNTSLATCVGADQVDQGRMLLDDMVKAEGAADVITYNTLMKGYAKAGRMNECFELFELLQKRNLTPSQVTYGILLDGCINENLLDRASTIFNTMVSRGCTMNTVLFTTLIKGFARAGEVDQAMKVYQQMRTERSVPPDRITFSILIKANCDADRLDKSLKLLDSMLELGLKPDEVIFNNLLAGCTRQSNAELGKRLYTDMVASGIRPSNATFSILIRLYHQCKMLDEAVEMIRTDPVTHNVDPEARLFLQLIQSCIRERQGRRAVEVYDLLLERSSPTVAAHGSMINTCVKLNMFDTAAEILVKAAEHCGRVDPNDANSLLEGAVRKRKFQVAAECAAAMERLGMSLDPKLLSDVKCLKREEQAT